jgi:hypothetical protein
VSQDNAQEKLNNSGAGPKGCYFMNDCREEYQTQIEPVLRKCRHQYWIAMAVFIAAFIGLGINAFYYGPSVAFNVSFVLFIVVIVPLTWLPVIKALKMVCPSCGKSPHARYFFLGIPIRLLPLFSYFRWPDSCSHCKCTFKGEAL